jgi:hypothetical protein
VTTTPESKSRDRNRWIIKELVKLYKEHLDRRLPVYDGKKSLFTAGPLPFKTKEFFLKLTNPDRANQGYSFAAHFVLCILSYSLVANLSVFQQRKGIQGSNQGCSEIRHVQS